MLGLDIRRRAALLVTAFLAACGAEKVTKLPTDDSVDVAVDSEAVDGAFPEDVFEDEGVEASDPGMPDLPDATDVTKEEVAQPCQGNVSCPCLNDADCKELCDETGSHCIQLKCMENPFGVEPSGLRCWNKGACTDDESCPDGWKCMMIAQEPEPVFACVFTFKDLCRPCKTDAECKGTGPAGNACVPHGPKGSYCGFACTEATDCPEGYSCEQVQAPGASKQCVPAGGAGCPCNLKFQEADYKTVCFVENENGKCTAERTCNEQCKAMTPAPETCNGGDDDCDGVVDEGFPDLDQDGKADCFDLDDDGDGIPDATDNCPILFNPDQKDCDGDGSGAACDDDDDGDGVPDATDNCICLPNADQADTDTDGAGDACDCDIDGDGVANPNPGCPMPGQKDNCAFTLNADQADMDADDLGDACDPDIDGDGDENGKDCAPTNPWISHNAFEKCGGDDEDCDGQTDEEGANGCKEYWRDSDGDGYGWIDDSACLCAPAVPFTADGIDDCDDTDAGVHPGAAEKCNGQDDDCDGETDEQTCP